MVAIFPASAKGGGVYLAFPDVCKFPFLGVPTPIPYPNIAKTAQEAQKKKPATKGAKVTRSKTSSSQGSEAGTQKGIVSSRNRDWAVFKMAAGKVKSEISSLKAMLSQLNGRLMGLRSDDPNPWQKLLQDYAVAASALYVTIQNDKG